MPPRKPTHSVSFRLTSEAFLALARLKRIHGTYNAAVESAILAAANAPIETAESKLAKKGGKK